MYVISYVDYNYRPTARLWCLLYTLLRPKSVKYFAIYIYKQIDCVF
jgi:hypothetical protein